MQKLTIHQRRRHRGREARFDANQAALDFRTRGVEHVLDQFGERCFDQIHFDGAREIEKAFHHRVKPIDLRVEHSHGLLRLFARGDVSLQVFKP